MIWLRRRTIHLMRGVACVAVLLAAVLPASAAHADPSRPEIFEALHVDEVPADYVILIDTSGSMNAGGLYGGVRDTLAAFLAGLAPGDHVAIYTFDDRPTPRYVGAASDPTRILESVPSAPTLSGQTDIGAAMSAALDELERPDAAAVAAVVLLTDGAHDPLPGSPFVGQDAPAWQELTQRAGRLKAHVSGYALSLRGVTGAAMLGSVFSSTSVLDPTSIGELAEYLNRAKEGTRIDKARSVLAADLGQGVAAIWSVDRTIDMTGGQAPVTLTLRAGTSHAPLVVSGVGVGVDGNAELTGDVPSTVELAPGEERSFDLTLHWAPKPNLIPFRHQAQLRTTLSVRGTVMSAWAAPVQPEIDLGTPTTIAGATRPVSASIVVGTWRAQLIFGGVVLVLVLVALTLLYLWRRAPQSGTLIATTGDNEHLGRFRLRGRGTRLRGQSLPGRGKVIARRVPQTYQNPSGIEYEVRYRRAEEWTRSRCPAGGSALVGGVNFAHEATSVPRQSQPERAPTSADAA